MSFTYYETKVFSNENHSKESFGFVYTMSLSENPDALKDFVMQVTRERRKLGMAVVYVASANYRTQMLPR